MREIEAAGEMVPRLVRSATPAYRGAEFHVRLGQLKADRRVLKASYRVLEQPDAVGGRGNGADDPQRGADDMGEAGVAGQVNVLLRQMSRARWVLWSYAHRMSSSASRSRPRRSATRPRGQAKCATRLADPRR
jgi:hypothetical protein